LHYSHIYSLKKHRTCVKSQTIQTAIIVFNNWASQEISLFNSAKMVEVEWTVGPIPVDDNIGKEVIVRFDTDIASQSKFYTDANGREVLERTRDYRPTWNYSKVETVSGNYYPINSRIWIKDANRQFTILTGKRNAYSYSNSICLFFIQIDRKVEVASMMDRLKLWYIVVHSMMMH